MDFKKPLNRWIAVGAGVLALVAIGLIIWGVTHHKEYTFMETCRVGDGVQYKSVEGIAAIEGEPAVVDCGMSDDPRWSKASFPLAVTALRHDSSPLSADHEAWLVIEQAIADANTQFGFRVFRKAVGQPSAVTIFWGVPSSDVPGGRSAGYVSHFYHRDSGSDLIHSPSGCDPSGLCAHVGLRRIESDRFAYIILMHEFGHVLFLGHDDYTASVMYHYSYDDSESANIMNWTRFVDGDVAGVRAAYMP